MSMKGDDSLIALLNNAQAALYNELPPVLQDIGNTVVIDARANHRYETKTGNLERDTVSKVIPEDLTVSIYLNNEYTKIRDDGLSYAVVQHQGTEDGSLPPDPFLFEANDRHEAWAVNEIQEAIWHTLTPTM